MLVPASAGIAWCEAAMTLDLVLFRHGIPR